MLIKIFKKIRLAYRLKNIKKTFMKYADIDGDTVYLQGAQCINTGSRDHVTIKSHCTIGAQFVCKFGGKIFVDQNTYIGPGTIIQSKESIAIGNNVIIANNVVIMDNNNHPTDPQMRMKMSACSDYMNDELWSWKYSESAPVVIEENVWIGRDARIMKGVTIGKGSIVALGAIVTHDVPSYCVVAGNPAKVVKHLS